MEASEAGRDLTTDAIAGIKKRINEVAFAPLSEHGALFEEINEDLSISLRSVEGLSN